MIMISVLVFFCDSLGCCTVNIGFVVLPAVEIHDAARKHNCHKLDPRSRDLVISMETNNLPSLDLRCFTAVIK